MSSYCITQQNSLPLLQCKPNSVLWCLGVNETINNKLEKDILFIFISYGVI